MDFAGKKVKLTITEGIKIFELALATSETKRDSRGSRFWLEVQKSNVTIPNRPGETMRDFWKEVMRLGIENYISKEVSEDSRYCHAFKQIPQMRPESSDNLYSAAQVRVFEAANAPVDSLRYKSNPSDLKKLRGSDFYSREDKKKAERALQSRMEKIKPRFAAAATMG